MMLLAKVQQACAAHSTHHVREVAGAVHAEAAAGRGVIVEQV